MASELEQQSQFSLSMLMSNLPGMVYRCRNDGDWTMEFVSAGCFELTGYQPPDLIGNKNVAYNDLIHQDDQSSVREQVQVALEGREPFRVVYRIKTATGEEKWVWEQGQGVYSKSEELIALEGFITNITDRSKAEKALKDSEARIQCYLFAAIR